MIGFLARLSKEEKQELISKMLRENYKIRNSFTNSEGYTIFILYLDNPENFIKLKLNDFRIESFGGKNLYALKVLYEFMCERFGEEWALQAIKYPEYEKLKPFRHKTIVYQYLVYVKEFNEGVQV